MPTGLGVDLGSETIKIVQVRVSGPTVTVTGALKLPRAVALPNGPEDEQLTPFVPENLGQELKRAGLRRSGTVGVSGREVGLKYLATPPMPPDKLQMFLDMELGEKMAGKLAAGGSGVTYDHRLLNLTAGPRGDLIIMAGMCKNEFLFGVSAALKAARFNVAQITPACFGLVNSYLRTQKINDQETVVLIDVGHELLEIAILEGRNIHFARSALGGGKRFTDALHKLLRLDPARTREFKHARARLHPDGTPLPGKQELAFQNALKEGAENIAAAIRSAVTFCRTQARLAKLDYQRVVLSGGGARLAGLQEYLEAKINRPVQVLDLYQNLDLRRLDAASAQCFEGGITDMAVALGLAIVDADPRSSHFALLPAPLVRKQEFWNKTIYGAAAGVILLLGLVPPLAASGRLRDGAEQRSAVYQQQIESAREKRKSFLAHVERDRLQADQVEYNARQTRLGQTYLKLFTRIREKTPRAVTVNYLGPATETTALGPQGSVGLGTWNAVDEPIRELLLRGSYEEAVYPNTRFNEAWTVMRGQLLEVPGVESAEYDPKMEFDQTAGPGTKLFQIKISLLDPARPSVWTKASAATASGQPGKAAPPK